MIRLNKRVQYVTTTEREQLIEENKDLKLILEVCSIDGNFLTFSNDISINDRIANIEEATKKLSEEDQKKIDRAIDAYTQELFDGGLLP